MCTRSIRWHRPWVLVLVSAMLAAHEASGQAASNYTGTVLDGCRVTFDFFSNTATSLDLTASDKQAVAWLIFDTFKAGSDMFAVLSQTSPPGTAQIPQAFVDDVNRLFEASEFLVPSLKFRVRSSKLSCPQAAMAEMKADQAARREKIERGMSFLKDTDPVIQTRGLNILMDETSNRELAAMLSTELRSRVIDIAFAQASQAVNSLSSGGLPKTGDFTFAPFGLLVAFHDPRVVDLYLTCVENGHTGIAKAALEALGSMQPRPTQALERLVEMIETGEFNSPLAEEWAMTAILRIGRQSSRPFFERLARGQNEIRAQLALKFLDSLTRAAQPPAPKDAGPARRQREPEIVHLPEHKI